MIITVLDWILVILIILFGTRFSYTDLKKNKIYNKDIAIFLGLSITIILIQTGLFFKDYNSFYILQSHLIRGLFGILIGFLFWITGLWAPADGKLFGALSFAIPGRFLIVSTGSDIMSLLSNTLVIISIAVILPNLKKLDKEDYKRVAQVLKPKSIIFSLLGVFGLLWLLRRIMGFLNINGNLLFTALVLVLIIGLFKVIFKLKFQTIILLLFLARLIFDYPNYFAIQEILMMIKVFIVYILLRMIILEGIFNKNTIKKNVDKLKVRDYLAIIPIKEKERVTFRKLNFFSFYNYISSALGLDDYEILGDYDRAIGLEEDNLEKIKKIFKERNMTEVLVFQTMPFAPYIVTGFLITIICRGDGFLLLGIFIKTLLWKFGILKI